MAVTRWRRWLGIWLVLAAGMAGGREPSPEPVLRIETGMHTTIIRRLVADAPRNRLLTASDDKTIRVWQMPQARLISVLRPPLDAGHEGRLFGLAVSPDGRTVAAGGWTGWDWDGSASIYFFDTLSGVLQRRIKDLPNTISGLVWHPDGKHLIVGLQGNAGLRVIRLADGATVAQDSQYKDKVMDLDLAANGRIAVVALDGMLRVYSPDFKLIGRKAVPGGKLPSAVRFSPDSRLIAVAVVDTPTVTLLDAGNLAVAEKQPKLGEISDLAGFTSLAWSSDGGRLYAGGEYRGADLNPLFYWEDNGSGSLHRLPLSRTRITELQQLPGRVIAYATEDPGLGQLGADDQPLGFRGPDVLDFSRAHGQLELSADGSVIRYPTSRGGWQSFSVFGTGDQDLHAKPSLALNKPRLASPRIRLENGQNSYKPLLNGKPPTLDAYEMSRSFAFSPDGQKVLLGTEWGLRLYDAEARQLWGVALPAVAWSVTVSGNGKFAVVAASDGTLRWFDMADGREVIAYFPHGNGSDWIAWVPDGYYMSSLYGDNYVGWHLNRGRDLTPDFYRAVQFERLLYRPDVVTAAFNAVAPNQAYKQAPGSAKADFRIAGLREIAPARVALNLARLAPAAGGARASLKLEAEKNQLDIGDYTVFVNGIPVTPSRERVLAKNERSRFSRTIDIDLYARDNIVRVETFNGTSMGVAESYVGLDREHQPPARSGDLYLLAVGVNKFTQLPEAMHLEFAAQDAAGIAKSLTEQARPQFRNVHFHLVNDFSPSKPNRAEVVAALDFLAKAGPGDTSIVFLASHGVSDAAGNYYFVPRDSDSADLKRISAGDAPKTLIGWQVFFDALRGAAGRRLLVVDTCHSQAIEGRFESHSLLKRSAASLFPILVSSRNDEESQEYTPASHGLFTYAIMQSMAPVADRNGDGILSLDELFESAKTIVDKLHDRKTGSQTPQFVSPLDLGHSPLIKFGGSKP